MNLKAKATKKRFWLITLALIAVVSVVAYAAVQDFTLNVPSSVAVVKADPGLGLVALDNSTVVTSIAFGNVVQGETGTWSGYLENTGNVDLRTFSISSSDIGSVGTVTWNIPASGDLPVGQTYPVTIELSINETADVGSHTFTIQITGSPAISGPTNITITASDPSDPYLRDWALTIDRPMPPIQDDMSADGYEALYSGDTMTFSAMLSSGPHYLMFIIGQSGGPSYGTYSGAISINGQVYNFSGVDQYNSVTIDFSV